MGVRKKGEVKGSGAKDRNDIGVVSTVSPETLRTHRSYGMLHL